MAATIQQIVKPTRARGLDTSGNNNHAQIYSGRALEFDGVTDYLNTGVTAATLGITNNVTVACWMNSADLAASRNAFIWNFYTSTSDGWGIKFSSSTFKIINDIDNADVNLYATSLNINIWYRVVVVLDNLEQKLYVNGELIGSGTSVADGLDSFTSNLYIGDRKSDGANLFNGMLSDFQVWDSAFSQSDVTYDYLNPEQLALNNGGTSLTNSNLKLWYPMNDGHRGNQSYILDASNTGLGEELVSNGDFSNGLTGFTERSIGAGESVELSTEQAHSGSYSAKIVTLDNSSGLQLSTVLVAGQTYKISAWFYVVDGNGFLNPADTYALNTSYATTTTTGEWENLVVYFTAKASTTSGEWLFLTDGTDDTSTFYVDDISVKAINAKYNATTVFFGNEQITNSKNRDFGSSSDWGVLNIAGGSLTEPSNRLQVVTSTDNEVEGAALAVGELVTPVAGRTYRISAKLDNTAGATTPTIQFRFAGGTAVNVTASDGSPSDGTIDTTEQEYYADVVAANTSGSLVIQNVASTDSTTFTIDDISVKEVGIASGWTDADQQLDIPQTALQSYNQLAWFEQSDETVIIADTTNDNDNIFDGGGTISAWIYPNNVGENNFGRIVDKSNAANGSNGYHLALYSESGTTSNIQFAKGHDTDIGTWSFDARYITYGKWQHIVVVYNDDDDGNNPIIYLNGESKTVVETAEPDGNEQSDASHALTIGNRSGATDRTFSGCITEVSMWSKSLGPTEVAELYNDGLALDATTHSSAQLKGYWRNNGLAVWQDLTSYNNDGTPTNFAESMLITAGADGSRDSQGFLMNSPRLTNCLNLPQIGMGANYIINSSEIKVLDTAIIANYGASDWSVECWFKAEVSGEPMFLATHQEADNNGEGWHIRWSSTNTIYFVVSDHDKDDMTVAVANALAVEEWHHIVCSYDYSADKKLVYINGILRQIQTDTSLGVIAPAANIHIGTRRGESDQDWVGQIDDFKIYNKLLSDGGVSTGVADNAGLTTAVTGEILRNYKAGKRSHR